MIENALAQRAALYSEIGKTALNVKYPKEFEMYTVALELVGGDGKTMKYFIFPINPSSIDEVNTRSTNIKKTSTGMIALSTTAFTHVDINLSGNFGRKFRVLLGTKYEDFIHSFQVVAGASANPDTSIWTTTEGSATSGAKELFDQRIKTGYGCLKILEEMCDLADAIDEKGPRRLYWYNLAFGSAYLVKPMSFRINMSQDNNMLHAYSLQLRALARLEDLLTAQEIEKSTEVLGKTAYIQKQTNNVVNKLEGIFTAKRFKKLG
jgi:hypothetical protein